MSKITFGPSTNARRFVLFTEPNVADPAWLMACAEQFGEGIAPIIYNDYSVIKEAIQTAELKQAESVGANKEMCRVLKMLHLDSYADFLQLAKDRGWKGKIC